MFALWIGYLKLKLCNCLVALALEHHKIEIALNSTTDAFAAPLYPPEYLMLSFLSSIFHIGGAMESPLSSVACALTLCVLTKIKLVRNAMKGKYLKKDNN